MPSVAYDLVKKIVPQPLKQLPWRIRWVVGTEAFAERPLRTFGRLLWWTATELVLTDVTIATPEGLRLHSMRNNIGSMAAYVSGDFENELHRFVAARLKPGDVFCDVGANIGRYTVQAACLVGPQGRVASFEAHPFTYGYLQRNIEAQRLGNVVSANVAVGAGRGTVALKFEPRDAGSTHIVSGRSASDVEVPQVALDDILPAHGIERIDYLKIDVEGFELFVLQGARRILADSLDVAIQIETDLRHLARSGVAIADVTDFLTRLGLSPHRLDTRGDLVAVDMADVQYGDFIWLKSPAVAADDARSGHRDEIALLGA